MISHQQEFFFPWRQASKQRSHSPFDVLSIFFTRNIDGVRLHYVAFLVCLLEFVRIMNFVCVDWWVFGCLHLTCWLLQFSFEHDAWSVERRRSLLVYAKRETYKINEMIKSFLLPWNSAKRNIMRKYVNRLGFLHSRYLRESLPSPYPIPVDLSRYKHGSHLNGIEILFRTFQ